MGHTYACLLIFHSKSKRSSHTYACGPMFSHESRQSGHRMHEQTCACVRECQGGCETPRVLAPDSTSPRSIAMAMSSGAGSHSRPVRAGRSDCVGYRGISFQHPGTKKSTGKTRRASGSSTSSLAERRHWVLLGADSVRIEGPCSYCRAPCAEYCNSCFHKVCPRCTNRAPEYAWCRACNKQRHGAEAEPYSN